MDNPLMKQDLADSIMELRNEVERRLMRNKYYVALRKLDDLLETIRPLEAEVIDEAAMRQAEPVALTRQPVLDAPAPPPAEPASEEIFAAAPQQVDVAGTYQDQDVHQAPEAPHPAPPQPQHVMPDPQHGMAPMHDGAGNVYQAPPQPAPQPVEEVFQPAAQPPQPSYDPNAMAPEPIQPAPQPVDNLFNPRHSAAE